MSKRWIWLLRWAIYLLALLLVAATKTYGWDDGLYYAAVFLGYTAGLTRALEDD